MMKHVSFGAHAFPVTHEMQWRHRFSIFGVLTTLTLIAWGGFVTSINAGLAVPDWPSSFNSYDPFNPWPEWWTITPVLAEHGHRLIGALTGLITLVLAFWTWKKDPRRWMRYLGFFALFLVTIQGILGGLRVVWTSLDLAVVHAGTAQIFFSLMVAMALFTSRTWLNVESVLSDSLHVSRLRFFSLATVLALYIQIILGALLRHPGTGVDPLLAALHISGAFLSGGLILSTFLLVRWAFTDSGAVSKTAGVTFGLLAFQLVLGLTAYFVLIDEAGMLRPSNVQVIVNTTHLVIGSLLMASTVALSILVLREPERISAGDSLKNKPVLASRIPESTAHI